MLNEEPNSESVQLDRLFQLFPTPWKSEVTPQEVPTSRLVATVYAADSTIICRIKGEHAPAIARMAASTPRLISALKESNEIIRMQTGTSSFAVEQALKEFRDNT